MPETVESNSAGSALPSGFLDDLEARIDAGLYLQVHPHIEALIADGGLRSALLAVRCLTHLGADRQGDALTLNTFRRFRQAPAAVTALVRQRFARFGPYVAWCLCRNDVTHQDCDDAEKAEFLSLQAYIYSLLRDFEQSASCHSQAVALAPEIPWLWVEWSNCCERADRYEEARQSVEEALRLRPAYRSALQQKAHLLVLDGEREVAEKLLIKTLASCESSAVGSQLYSLQFDRQDYVAAGATLARIEALMPRADKAMQSWLAAQRCDLAMAGHRRDEAREQAAKVVGLGFYRNVLERIDAGIEHRRVLLPVSFVRQHWMTCSPATLSALAQYFGMPAQHLDIAAEICYDGTADHSERRWARENGFYVREFRVDLETAQALIDTGIPFALATVFGTSGHLQAVVGYDALRGSLLIRDPYQPTFTEFDAQALFDSHQASGPRGLLLVPEADRHRLAAIVLPEADLWDLYHELVSALANHARELACEVLERLQAMGQGHRLALMGERSLAFYDGDEPRILRLTDQLLSRYPDYLPLQISRAHSLQMVGGRQQHLGYLEELMARPSPAAPLLTRYSRLLAEDGRRLNEAQRFQRRALKMDPFDAFGWYGLGDLAWLAGNQQEALALCRIAVCLNDTDESLASEFMRLCHVAGHSEAGLDFLRERVRCLGQKSPAPAVTLAQHLERLERTSEAFTLLEETLAQHPAAADVGVFYAEALIRNGLADSAMTILERGDTGVRKAEWLKVRALLAQTQGDLPAARDFVLQAVALQPLNLAHHRLAARLLAAIEGRQAAVDWLRLARDQHPQHYGLNRLLYDWLLRDSAEEESQLRRMIELFAGDAWAWRELASLLSRKRQWDEAERAAREALQRSPRVAASHGTLAAVLLHRDGYQAAETSLREAIRLDVDYDYAISTLIEKAPSRECGLAAIDFVYDELVRQVTIGDALLSFQSAAHAWLSAEAVLPRLREAHQARPDLWQSWIAYGSQLVRSGQAEAAVELFAAGALRFPSMPRLFVEHAQALRNLDRRDEAIAQLTRALEISPGWNRAVRLFVDLCHEGGRDWQEAVSVLQRALRTEPMDADLRGLLGWVHERRGEFEPAWLCVSESLQADPSQKWVWDLARRVLQKLGREDELERVLTGIEETRGGDPWTWLARAYMTADTATALAAAEQATVLDPRLVDAWSLRFDLLLKLRRPGEIPPLLAVLDWPQGVPVSLRQYGCLALRAEQQCAAAYQNLRALIDEAPNQYTLHRLLADWLDADDDHQAYLASSRELVRIAPHYAVAHGYVGHALAKLGRDDDAIVSFERAYALDGEYSFAGERLLERYVPRERYRDALNVAEKLWCRAQNLAVAADATVAAARALEQDSARSWFIRILEHGGYEVKSTNRAFDAILSVGWTDLAEGIVEQCIRKGVCAHAAVLRWLTSFHEIRNDKRFLRDLDDLIRNEGGIALKMALLDYTASAGRYHLLEKVVARYRSLLRSHDSTWGQVSYALQSHGQHSATRHWLDDWRSRPNAPCWALGNASLAHASLNQFDRAAEIARQALSREANNPDARLWHCIDLALQKQTAMLDAEMQRLDEWEPDPWMRHPVRLLHALSETIRSGDISATIVALDTLRHGCREMPSMRYFHRRVCYRLFGLCKWWQWPRVFVAMIT